MVPTLRADQQCGASEGDPWKKPLNSLRTLFYSQQRHISCKKVLVLVPHVLDLHDSQFCSYAAEHPSNTES